MDICCNRKMIPKGIRGLNLHLLGNFDYQQKIIHIILQLVLGYSADAHLELCQISIMQLLEKIVNPLSANPQNGQAHSNNLSNYLCVSDHFVGLTFKGLTIFGKISITDV